MGYCGLDRQRKPLSGDEIRACWEASPEPAAAGTTKASPPVLTRTPVPRRDFIEVIQGTRETRARKSSSETPIVEPAPAVIAPRWSLWEDAEG